MQVTGVCFDPRTPSVLAMCDMYGFLVVADVADITNLVVLAQFMPDQGAKINSIKFSHSGAHLAVGGRGQRAKIFARSPGLQFDDGAGAGEEAAGQGRNGVQTVPAHVLARHDDFIVCVDWSHDDARLVSSSWDHTCHVFDATNAFQLLYTLGADYHTDKVQFLLWRVAW